MRRGFIVFALCLMASLATAQVDRATLSGLVRDSSGGVLPGAQMSLTNLATGVKATVTTTGEGTFFAPDLAPGDYAVEAALSGFQSQVLTVHLTVGQRGR